MAWLHAVVDLPGGVHDTGARFWSAALGWPVGAPWPGHPELRSFTPADGEAYVHLQKVDGPPRVHLDVESPEPGSTVSAAVTAGAEVVGRHQRWMTLRSPGGLPFCVVAAGASTAPGPVVWPDGHRTRLVQVCVDSPGDRHEEEVEFWRSLLHGRWVGSASEEFAGKWHDDAGSPLQLLFQRLDEADGPVRAHLDLGTDDRAVEVSRLLQLGAADGPTGRGWHVLRDPTGLDFCVTDNPPDQTRSRDLV
jgi:hypothetical protein